MDSSDQCTFTEINLLNEAISYTCKLEMIKFNILDTITKLFHYYFSDNSLKNIVSKMYFPLTFFNSYTCILERGVCGHW